MSNFEGLTIDDIASVCHEANRQLQRILGEVVNFPWENTSEEMRESARIGVDGVLAGNTPEQSHELWVTTKTAQGWVYGEKKDFAKKTHPLLVPYDDVPTEHKLKDVLFAKVVEALEMGG